MSIELNEEQLLALDAQAADTPRVIDPRNNAAYYLVAALDYDAVRELLEEEKQLKAIRAVGLRNAECRMEEEP